MKKHLFILAAALVCVATACNQDVISPEDQEKEYSNVVTYIQATEESATKASIDGSTAAFSWNTGDQIAVYAGEYKISNGLEDTYNGTNAAKFAFSGDNAVTEANRADFAVFPASLVWNGTSIRTNSATNHTASSLTLTLPDSYTLAQVQDDVSPCPMIAANTENGSLSFKHLCALLRITVYNIPKSTSYLAFDFNGNKVQGVFTLSSVNPGSTSIETVATTGTDDIIRVTGMSLTQWTDSLVVNLPLPTGTYTTVTVTAYNSSDQVVLTMTRPIKVSSDWKPTRLSSRKIDAALPAFCVSYISESSTYNRHVAFAPSNLIYTPNTKTWAFHAHPYDICEAYPGAHHTESSRYTAEGDKPIDLFGWGTSGYDQFTSGSYGSAVQPYSTSLDASQYGPTDASQNLVMSFANGDWGINAGSLGGYSNWRTPTMTEWGYVRNLAFDKRKTNCIYARALLSYVTSSGNSNLHINGVFLFPDHWDSSLNGTQIVPNGGFFNEVKSEKTWVTQAEYERMIAAGAVFLPYTGTRTANEAHTACTRHTIGSPGSRYWSSTTLNTDQTQAFAICIDDDNFYYDKHYTREKGFPVRLVRDLQ